MASLLKHYAAKRLRLSLMVVVLAFAALSAGDAQAVCSVVNGACGGGAATCSAGSVTGDNGQTACGTTRTWGCMGTGGGTTASCSTANAACCSPNWQISGYGSCNASCGNYGSQSVTMTDYACGGGSYQTSQSCYGGACCTPSWYVTGTSGCSASCGPGSQTVYYSDGCGGTTTNSQSCNNGACCTPSWYECVPAHTIWISPTMDCYQMNPWGPSHHTCTGTSSFCDPCSGQTAVYTWTTCTC